MGAAAVIAVTATAAPPTPRPILIFLVFLLSEDGQQRPSHNIPPSSMFSYTTLQ